MRNQRSCQYIISVIVPVYNAEKYIRRCVDSILNQTFEQFELLLIDDGSTDRSLAICDSYTYDKRIRVIHQTNQGVSVSRNNGIGNAVGQYIAFVDSDDFLEPDALDVFLSAIEENACDLVCASFQLVSMTEMLCRRKLKRERLSSVQLASLCYHNGFDVIVGSVWGKLYRKDIIEKYKIRFPDNISYAEDNVFNIQYYQYINSAMMLDNVIYNYFYNDNSLTTKIRDKTFDDFIYVSKERKKYYQALLTDFRVDDFANRTLSTLLILLRQMECQYNVSAAINNIKRLMTGECIEECINDSKCKRNIKLYVNIFIALAKTRTAICIMAFLILLNHVAKVMSFFRSIKIK